MYNPTQSLILARHIPVLVRTNIKTSSTDIRMAVMSLLLLLPILHTCLKQAVATGLQRSVRWSSTNLANHNIAYEPRDDDDEIFNRRSSITLCALCASPASLSPCSSHPFASSTPPPHLISPACHSGHWPQPQPQPRSQLTALPTVPAPALAERNTHPHPRAC